MTLTPKLVESIRLPKKPDTKDVFDKGSQGNTNNKGGLVLRVSYGGTKSYKIQYYVKGKARYKTIGRHPDMTLSAARRKTREFLNSATQAAEVQKSKLFKEVVESWYLHEVIGRRLRSASAIRRDVDRYLLPAWHDTPMARIGREKIQAVLYHIRDTSGPRTADLVLQTISGICRFHQTWTDGYTSPVVPSMRLDKRTVTERIRQRWLDDAEIGEIWRKSGDAGTYGVLTRLLLLTGQRRAKILGMKWSDIDLHTGVWTIPRGEREKGTPERLTLPPGARELLNEQPMRGKDTFVLYTPSGCAYSAHATDKAKFDSRLDSVKPYRLHDLRRTTRALLTRVGTNSDIAEMILGHKFEVVRRTYDSEREYQSQMDEALARVDAEIQRLAANK
ncbi:MAG: integrase family protein [Alphaproteobacteria bacterium]